MKALAEYRSLAEFTSESLPAEELLQLCQSIRKLHDQPENQQRIRKEIHRASERPRIYSFLLTQHPSEETPILHTCIQTASLITRQKSSAQILSHDLTWQSARSHTKFDEKGQIAIIDISDLDNWGLFLGQFESAVAIAGTNSASGCLDTRKWHDITKTELQDWITAEHVSLNVKDILDVPAPSIAPKTGKTLFAITAKATWEKRPDALLDLEPMVREKYLSQLASDDISLSAPSTNVVLFFESLLSGLSTVNLGAMPFLTPENITNLARTCGSTWTSLDLSTHGRLQTQDIVSIIEYVPGLRLLSLGSARSLTFDLPKILQKARDRCRIEHPALYQAYFDYKGSQRVAEGLIGQIVVARTDPVETQFQFAPAAADYLPIWRLGGVLKCMKQHFARKAPARSLDALAIIESAIALEENHAVRPMPRLRRKWATWTTWRLDDIELPYNFDSWTLLVRYRKDDLHTFEFTFARVVKIKKRKRSEIDTQITHIVLGGLELVAKTEGLTSVIEGSDLDAPATWTDESANITFKKVLKKFKKNGLE